MITFLSGAIAMGFLVAALFFLRFWRRTDDRLFLAFSLAFALLALESGLVALPAPIYQPTDFKYLLRVLAFVIILVAIVDKNLARGRRGEG